jgi:hypothetical protein
VNREPRIDIEQTTLVSELQLNHSSIVEFHPYRNIVNIVQLRRIHLYPLRTCPASQAMLPAPT